MLLQVRDDRHLAPAPPAPHPQMADREDIHSKFNFEVVDDDNLTTQAPAGTGTPMIQQEFCVVPQAAATETPREPQGHLRHSSPQPAFTEVTSNEMRELASRAGDGDLAA